MNATPSLHAPQSSLFLDPCIQPVATACLLYLFTVSRFFSPLVKVPIHGPGSVIYHFSLDRNRLKASRLFLPSVPAARYLILTCLPPQPLPLHSMQLYSCWTGHQRILEALPLLPCELWVPKLIPPCPPTGSRVRCPLVPKLAPQFTQLSNEGNDITYIRSLLWGLNESVCAVLN